MVHHFGSSARRSDARLKRHHLGHADDFRNLQLHSSRRRFRLFSNISFSQSQHHRCRGVRPFGDVEVDRKPIARRYGIQGLPQHGFWEWLYQNQSFSRQRLDVYRCDRSERSNLLLRDHLSELKWRRKLFLSASKDDCSVK